LIRAALELIAQKRPGWLTFAGSPRAGPAFLRRALPHFRDRDELLADVARRGFEHSRPRWSALG